MAAGVCSHSSRLAAKQGGAFRRELHGLSITTATDCPWRYTAGFRTLWRVILALTSSEDVVGNGERIVPFMAIVLFRGKICEGDERLKGTLIHASIGFSVHFFIGIFFFKLETSLVSYIIILIISIVFLKFLVFIYFFFFFYCLTFSYKYFSMIFIGFIINLFGRYKFISWINKRKNIILNYNIDREDEYKFWLFELYWIFILDFHLFLWLHIK